MITAKTKDIFGLETITSTRPPINKIILRIAIDKVEPSTFWTIDVSTVSLLSISPDFALSNQVVD